MGSVSRLVGVALVLFVVSSTRSYAESFVVPFSANLYLEVRGGEAASRGMVDFGLGTAPTNFIPYLRNLAPNTSLEGEVFLGFFGAGETVHFGMRATFLGDTAWGFSNGNDQWSRVAFTDMDNSLGMGGRSIERTGANTWLMHLDYANLGFDDDDNDIVIQIRLATGGDPGQATKTVLTGKYYFSNFGALGVCPSISLT